MGLIANYSYLSDVNLKELKSMGSEEEEILESALESFDMKACKEAELYPDIWDYEEEEEEIKDEILHDFEQMKVFYKKVLEAKGHVLVSIC